MNRVNDEFALWSEDFTDRMRRMCQEAEQKRQKGARKIYGIALAIGISTLLWFAFIYAALYAYRML